MVHHKVKKRVLHLWNYPGVYLVFIIPFFILSCGEKGIVPVDSGDSGTIAPKVQWDYRGNLSISYVEGSSVEGSRTGKALYKAPLGVYKIRATLLDPGNNPVSGFQKTRDVTPGESGMIVFADVSAGTYNVKIEGLDINGSDILYSGQTNGVNITVGEIIEPSVIVRYTRSDTASPGSSDHSPANGATNVPANTQISVHVSDNGAGVDANSIKLIVNGADVTSKCTISGTSDNYAVIYTPLANLSGTVTVTLYASDLANPPNSMATETWGFTIATGGTKDTNAPTNPTISFGDVTETTSQAVTATLSAFDDTGVTGYYLSETSITPTSSSGGWVSVLPTRSYSKNVSFTLSTGNGSKTVYAWFRDAAGNISTSASATIALNQTDITPPTPGVMTITGTYNSTSSTTSTTTSRVTISLTATDDTGVTGYYLSESPITPSLIATGWTNVTASKSYSGTTEFNLSGGGIDDDIKTVYAWFRDAAGNISEWWVRDSIILTVSDTTQPSNASISIDSGAASTTLTSVTVTLSATDDTGVTGYCARESSTTPSNNDTCWIPVNSTTNYSANVSFTLSTGSGTKTVYVWFKDEAGNVSGGVSDSIIVWTWTWIRQTGTACTDEAYSITVDSSGNVYVTGTTNCGLDGNISAGSNDIFLIKYDLNGAKQWTRQLGTTSNDTATGVALDSSGNVYVTGYTLGNLDGNISAGSFDIFLIKYDSNGVKQWTRQIGTSGDDKAYGVTIQSSGHVYVTGSTNGGLDENSNAGGYDIFLTQYDSSGIKQWTRQIGTTGDDIATGVAVDSSGFVDNFSTVRVTGYTGGSLDGNTSAGSNDIFLIKYDPNGVKQWTRQLGTSGDDKAYGVAVDSSGNVYVSGSTNGGLNGNSNAGGYDIFLVKYNTSAVEDWTRQIGTANNEGANGVAVDTSGDVYVTGSTPGNLDGNAGAGSQDLFVVKYYSFGTKQWTRQIGTTAYDLATGVAVDSSNIYVTGYTGGGLDGNSSAGMTDIFVCKF